ncbi:MAG: P-loop NTPase [Candidatus Saliniplasma sp.]
MNIVIASGKGGTGKTFIATNLTVTLDRLGRKVTYLDCDVEEPDGHLFLKPDIYERRDITLESPVGVDEVKCIACGQCAEACKYNAIAMVKKDLLFFPELCHVCGACSIVCPTDAIIEKEKNIGVLKKGRSGSIEVDYSLLKTGEGGMSPRLINEVKEQAKDGVNVIDAPPGTACPAVESVAGADLAVLVTDPTPFGINDLRLAVNMCRAIGLEPVVVVNRAEYRDNKLKEYCDEAELEIVGEIPDDRRIAEVYSTGDMVVNELDEYKNLFEEIAKDLERMAQEERELKPHEKMEYKGEKMRSSDLRIEPGTKTGRKAKELVVISGKGGTGKTSLTAAFAALNKKTTISDCDVDAADLHLITDPQVIQSGLFSGGFSAEIDQDACTSCGGCHEYCRFDAVNRIEENGNLRFEIDEFACEGCGVCGIVCENDAVILEDAVNGEWFVSETRFGPMSHATLGIAEENTGRLVTVVREKAQEVFSSKSDINDDIIVDGAPGTGCPVIASITGVDYALIVTEPTVSGIHDMERVIDVAKHFGAKAGVVVNKSDLNEEMTEKIVDMCEKEGVEFLGKIPYNNSFTEAQMEKKSVVEYTDNETTRAIEGIWSKIKRDVLK